ncbi:MAG: hypothetical protein ACYDEH_02145 [Acidimicrobiales bacterium]
MIVPMNIDRNPGSHFSAASMAHMTPKLIRRASFGHAVWQF